MSSRQIILLAAKSNFLNLFFQFNAALHIQFWESSNCDRQTEWLEYCEIRRSNITFFRWCCPCSDHCGCSLYWKDCKVLHSGLNCFDIWGSPAQFDMRCYNSQYFSPFQYFQYAFQSENWELKHSEVKPRDMML